MSIIFYHNDTQKKIAEQRKSLDEKKNGKKIYIKIIPYTKLYLAENYHQKYYLQLIKELSREVQSRHENFLAFVNSTSAARINGYVKGYGDFNGLIREIDNLGLSDRGRKILIEVVDSYGK